MRFQLVLHIPNIDTFYLRCQYFKSDKHRYLDCYELSAATATATKQKMIFSCSYFPFSRKMQCAGRSPIYSLSLPQTIRMSIFT